MEQQGLIQAFEFTHELAWNTLKDFLEAHGTTNLYGSKDASREAFATGLIENGEAWMAMIKSRNQTTHTYNEEMADEIGAAITSSYLAEFEKFQTRVCETGKTGRISAQHGLADRVHRVLSQFPEVEEGVL